MLGWILLGGVFVGANVIGYKLYCDNNNKKLRKKYNKDKDKTIITLKEKDIKEVK